MNPSPRFRWTSLVMVGLVGSAFGGCSDVGEDNTAATGEDASIDATGSDGTAFTSPDSSEGEGAVTAPGVDSDGSGEAAQDDGSSTQSPEADANDTPDEGPVAASDAEADAGVVPRVDAGGTSTAGAGGDAGIIGIMTVEAGVDGGAHPPTDAGGDASVDAGHEKLADAEADVSVDASHVPDATVLPADAGASGGVCAPICDPTRDPNGICTNGITRGVGGSACNQTETLFWNEDQGAATAGDCLRCVLNAGCLDFTGPGSVTGVDCDDLSGTVASTATAGAGTGFKDDCLSLLSCELTSGCGFANPIECYCGLNVSSTTCKTSQTGACVPQVQVGIASTDPNYILTNFTELSMPNGGATADELLTCAQANCADSCFVHRAP